MRTLPNYGVAIVATLFLVSAASQIGAQSSSEVSRLGTMTKAQPGGPAVALDHLVNAKAALDAVAPASVSGDAASKLAEIRHHFEALERGYRSGGSKGVSTEQTPSGSTRVTIVHKANWTAHVPEIDRRLGQLLDSPSTLDAAARSKLADMRKHLTAFAAAATGTFGAAATSSDRPAR